MTNILVISPYFWEPPKKFLVTFWTAVNLRRRGHKVIVISSRIYNSCDREVVKGVHIYRVPAFHFSGIPWPIAFPAHLWKLIGYIVDRYKIDIVHLQEPLFPSTFLAAFYCKIRRLPHVVTTHASYFRFGRGLLPDILISIYVHTIGMLTLRFSERVFAISEGQIQILLKLGVPREKIVITPPGIDTDTSVFARATEKDREKARKLLNLTEEDFVIGFVGRLVPEKNVGLLIEAARLLSREIEKLKLLIVGEGVNEGLLKKKVVEGRLENSVLFLGWRDDIDKILPAMDVFAFPSLSDGLGRASVEAMAVGVPVVSTDIPGPASVIANGKNGLLVPRNNLAAIVKAILRLYENEELRKRLGDEGTNVSKIFSWNSFTSKLEKAYGEVLRSINA